MADQDKQQSEGRKANAAQTPPDAKHPAGDAGAYPAARRDDSVEAGERRSFDPPKNPEPPQGAGDGSTPAATNDGRTGPEGDPAEGKR